MILCEINIVRKRIKKIRKNGVRPNKIEEKSLRSLLSNHATNGNRKNGNSKAINNPADSAIVEGLSVVTPKPDLDKANAAATSQTKIETPEQIMSAMSVFIVSA